MNSLAVILVIFFVLICLGGLSYGMYITQKQLTKGWKEFAEEEGFHFSPGILPVIKPKMKGNYKGYEVNTSIISDGTGEHSDWHTVIKMALPDTGILHLHIKNKSKYKINPLNIFSGGPLIEKKNEIETFENSFDITCNHNEMGKKIISREIEEELMNYRSVDIKILDNHIYYEAMSGYVEDGEKLKSIYELLLKMAKNIS